MPGNSDHKVSPQNDTDGMAQAFNAALAEVHRGLKAITFYPEHHPLRNEILTRAYQAMLSLMKGHGVSLLVQRNGLSFADREVAIENTPLTSALAKELFAREIQQLSVLPELTLQEFTGFLTILATEPNRIIARGGMDGLLREQGIHAVIANEIDITAVFSKKTVVEPANETVPETSGTQDGSEQGPQIAEAGLSDDLGELGVEELITLMQIEADDDRFCQMANYLHVKGQQLKREGNFDRLFPVLLSLLDLTADKSRSALKRECAHTAFRQLAREEMTEHLLEHLGDKDFSKQENVNLILARLGGEVVNTVIRRMVATNDLFARKALSTTLVRIGHPAVHQLLEVLQDNRWQVVRTAVTILGDIGSRDAVQGLTQSAYHTDSRVRVEAIRSLARIGGKEATLLLIDLLHDKSQAIRKQAIIWMGNTKNEKAVEPLLGLLMKRDLLGKSEPIKKEALMAIGRIGDKRALDTLFRLVRKNHWIARGSWERLKLLALEIIGQLGGESSKEILGNLSARRGRIGQACSAMLETMEQGTSDHHE